MKKLALIHAVFVLALTAASALSGTYYIDGNVAASGNGLSWETAKKTFAELYAILANNTGHLVLIRGDQQYTVSNLEFTKNGASDSQRQVWRGVPGTNGMGRLPIVTTAADWDESAFSPTGTYDKVFWIPTGGTVVTKVWDAPLGGEWGYDWRLYSQSASVALVQTNPASWYSDGTTLFIHTRDGSAPSNFILKSVPTSGANQAFGVYGQYVTFENLEFRHYTGAGVTCHSGSRYINVQSNIIHAIAAHGVTIGNANVHHCKVTDNTIFTGTAAVGTSGAGINSLGTDHVFSGNSLYGNGSGISGGAERTLIQGNVVYSNTARGIFLNPAHNTALYNNMIFANVSLGMRLINATNAVICNNTLYHNQGSELYLDGSSPYATIFNNSISAAGSEAYGIYVNSGAQTGLLSDHNNLHTDGVAYVGRWPNANHATLAAWQTASSQDANSISAEPRLVNPAAGDLHLDDGSPCIDAGTAALGGVSAPALDIDGDARPLGNAHEIGADEFLPRGTLILVR